MLSAFPASCADVGRRDVISAREDAEAEVLLDGSVPIQVDMPREPANWTIQVIRLFLASPGDVADERLAVRRVIGALNLSLEAYGWRVELHGWEDRGPTGGRPQADINTDVERCDLFLGILWRRWGTRTGDSSSGFAEEWQLAQGRFARTGHPNLWLYFKHVGTDAVEDEQLAEVRAFRQHVEESEVAFHKTFADLAEFEELVRQKILGAIFERTELTHADIGVLTVDWPSAYREDPVWLISGGSDRLTVAEGTFESAPESAAQLLSELGDQLQGLGFNRRAGALRLQAAQALIAAGNPDSAVQLLRRVLRHDIWWLRLEEAGIVLRDLDETWPPELASELRAWRACCGALRDPADAAVRLEEALAQHHAFPLDEETEAIWRGLLWRCWLHLDRPDCVLADDAMLPPLATDPGIELNLMHADALRAAGDPGADDAWRELRLTALQRAQSDPETSAWISTRCAYDTTLQECMPEAEAAYLDAASRWTRAGRHEQAALAYFSAQAAGRLESVWNFAGWAWREAAASQRESVLSFASRARELETQALSTRSPDHDRTLPLFTGALWLQQRAGLVQGVLKELAFAADESAAQGRHRDAVQLYCRTRDGDRARTVAERASDPASIIEVLRGEWPSWSSDARCAVLGGVGSCASPQAAQELLQMVLAALTPSDTTLDNTHRKAADALAQLALVVEDDRGVAARLLQLAGERDLSLATGGRLGLRLLADIGREIDIDALVERFAQDGRPSEPNPQWIADRLTKQSRIDVVRQAALSGHHLRALTALALAGTAATADDQLRERYKHITINMLNSNLGMTPDGTGVAGLIAFESQGLFAAATGDPTLMRAAAEAFLGYALETRWPMNNRVSALKGLWPLIQPAADDDWLTRLRPLANPTLDLDAESPRWWQMWARLGDLEAMAIRVCASHQLPAGPPHWLDTAIREAAFDARLPLREAAWFAGAKRREWFDSHGARHALLDHESSVRAAALYAWRQQSTEPLPEDVALRLSETDDVRVRLALTWLIKRQPNERVARQLRQDPDAYVRGVARLELNG